MTTRPYVGLKPGVREVFYSATEPTEATHGHVYNAVIGPFLTRRGADYMAQYGQGNPHCRCVAEAEKLAAILASPKLPAPRSTPKSRARLAAELGKSINL